MKKIEHEIKVDGTIHDVYGALTTLQGLESWHSAHIEENNHEFKMIHENHPSFTWKIVNIQPDQQVEWECTNGPGNATGTTVFFTLSSCDDDRVLIQCTHQDWPDNDDHFKKCNTFWGMLLNHLKEFVETGTVNPTFN